MDSHNFQYFCSRKRPRLIARMAELVDALVSKTNEVTLVPVRSRPRVQLISFPNKKAFFLYFHFFVMNNTPKRLPIYLPILFAIVLIVGILIGQRINPGAGLKQNFIPIKSHSQ